MHQRQNHLLNRFNVQELVFKAVLYALRNLLMERFDMACIPQHVNPLIWMKHLLIQGGKKAMEEEYNALLRNKTWHLVPARKGMNIIDCRWVFKVKRKADGTIDRYK